MLSGSNTFEGAFHKRNVSNKTCDKMVSGGNL